MCTLTMFNIHYCNDSHVAQLKQEELKNPLLEKRFRRSHRPVLRIQVEAETWPALRHGAEKKLQYRTQCTRPSFGPAYKRHTAQSSCFWIIFQVSTDDVVLAYSFILTSFARTARSIDFTDYYYNYLLELHLQWSILNIYIYHPS